MRAIIAVAILAAATGAFPQTLTETIEVSVVNVDVTVTDRKGQPIRGLTRDDFEVFEDGVLQPISNFYAVENNGFGAGEARPNARPTSQIVPTVTEDRFRRKVLVIVDQIHTTRYNRGVALRRLESFISDRFSAGEYDWSIAVATSSVHTVLPLTSDKQSIHTALELVRRGMTWKTYSDALDVHDNARALGVDVDTLACFTENLDTAERGMLAAHTFLAIRDAVRAFAGIDGKKIILLFSSGLEIPKHPSRASRALMILRDSVIREANASNVNLYIINPEGLVAPGDMAPEFAPPPTDNSTLYWMARETGGRLFPGNRPQASLRQFDRLSSNFYSIGYKASHGEDGVYHRIKIRLKNGGKYELQHRDGYASILTDVQLVR